MDQIFPYKSRVPRETDPILMKYSTSKTGTKARTEMLTEAVPTMDVEAATMIGSYPWTSCAHTNGNEGVCARQFGFIYRAKWKHPNLRKR